MSSTLDELIEEIKRTKRVSEEELLKALSERREELEKILEKLMSEKGKE